MRSTTNHLLTCSSAAAWLALAVPAQSQLVSPPSQATADDADASSSLPFLKDTPRRYLQIHSDLIGQPLLIGKLAQRRDQNSALGTGTRRVDCELFIGESVSWDRPSWLFTANYVGPRTQVMARRFVDLPALTSASIPPAFELEFTFDTPWTYAGLGSFAWEASVYDAQTTGTYATRADAYGASTTVGAPAIQTGLGCYATGMTQPMLHQILLSDAAGTLLVAGSVDAAPASGLCMLMLGLANPNQAFPGLCSPVYTDMLLGLPVGAADTNGFLGEMQFGTKAQGGAFAFTVPNTVQGATFFSQVHAIDLGSSYAFQIANSDGLQWTAPTSDLSRPNKVTRVYNDDAQPNGTRAVSVAEGNVGFGVVVQFSN